MDEEILGAEQQFQLTSHDNCLTSEQQLFDQIVMALQEIILDEEFQTKQNQFMKRQCQELAGTDVSPAKITSIFASYQIQISNLLQSKMQSKIHSFDLYLFARDLPDHQNKIDDVLYELVMSCYDPKFFEGLLMDYQTAHQQQERYRVLTIKTNKLPQSKKVKGNCENIFANANLLSFAGKNPNKKKMGQKRSSKILQKNEDQLMVAEKVLTVKGLRKT